ncbi:MAG: hypothetical protein O2795_13445 [Acidobacteria bacterium]|nr:hypothetical protein [Acidobacteriota bacterium]
MGGNNAFVAKLDSVGKLVWAKHLVGGGFAMGASIAVDVSGNVLLTGLFAGINDFDPGPGELLLGSVGSVDIFVTKLDSNGNLVWARVMGGPLRDRGNGVAVDGIGNVYVTGEFEGTADFGPLSNGGPLVRNSAGLQDIFVVKLDSAGNSVWAQAMGGPGFDTGSGVAVDASGRVYTTGRFSDRAIFELFVVRGRPRARSLTSAGGSDVFVTKHDSEGSLDWYKQMGSPFEDEGNGIALDASGNVYLAGEFEGVSDFDPSAGVSELDAAGGADVFLTKLDSDGGFEWVRNMGGAGTDSGNDVAVDGGGNAYTTGSFKFASFFDRDLSVVSSGGAPVRAGRLDSFGESDAFVAKFNDLSESGLPPVISEGGIVLATLLPTVNTVSPRSIISVFGQNFSTTTTLFPELDGNGNLARGLGGSCLEMNGERLPIFAITPGQINAQASAAQTFGPASFQVITNCNTSNALLSEPVTVALGSNAESATVETATPGFFLFEPLANDGFIAARFNSDAVIVAPAGLFNDDFGPSRPAKPGEIIAMFGTGWGPTTASLDTGQLAPGAAELLPNANPTVSFGGFVLNPQDVPYVGVAPGTAGLYQLVIYVPAGAQTGNHQVVLNVYGKSTPVGPVVPVVRP